MGLKTIPHITSDFIYKHITDEDIFDAYHGPVVLGTVESSKFREDNHPSCGFYINKKGRIIYSDIATGEKLDAFAYVAKAEKITYKEALEKVADDFGLTGKPPIYKVGEHKAPLVKEEKIIEIEKLPWDKVHLKYWKQFGITKEELDREEIFPVKDVYINEELKENYDHNMRFAYIIRWKDKKYYKIYAPYSLTKKGKWISNVPIYLPFGFDKLPYIDDRLIITKSQKERLIFLKYFDDVIGLQNESPSSLRDSTIKYLKTKYKHLLLFFDNDEAGHKASEYYVKRGLVPIFLPDIEGIKDHAEFVAKYGLKRFEDFLKYIKLI